MTVREICLVVLAAIFLIVPSALLRPMQTPDEGRYAEVARETAVAGNWLIPTLNTQPHLTKSPVHTDLVALVFKAFGANTFTSRLIPIAAFLGLLVFSISWAQAHAGRRAGVLAAVTTLTMFYPVMAGQFGDLNMLFNYFVAIGLALFFDAMRSERIWGGVIAWTALGVAFAVKGPPVLGILIVTLIIYRVLSGRGLDRKFSWWIIGAAILAVIGVAWYAWIIHEFGFARMKAFWFAKALERTAANEDGKPFFYHFFYLPVFLVLSSGWGVCMLQLWWRGMKSRGGASRWRAAIAALRSRPADEQWLISWLLATLVLFSAMRAHMLSYIQPAYHAAVLLLALYGARRWSRPDVVTLYRRWATAGAIATVLVTWGASAFLFVQAHRGGSGGGKDVAVVAMARVMNSLPDRNWDLVQCGQYIPTISFLTGRNSILCNHDIHEQWPMPPELSLEKRGLRNRIAAGQPTIVLLRRKDMKKYFAEPHASLRTLAEGEDLIVLTNK